MNHFFYYFFMVYSPPSSDSATSVGLSIRLSVRPQDNVLMLRHVYAYLYVGPAKDLVMGLSAHDQTFAF